MVAVVVEGKLAWPAVVGLPGRIRTLENEIRLAIVSHNEHDVALPAAAFRRELAEVNAAHPLARDRQRSAWRPLRIPAPLGPDGRVGLSHPLEGAKAFHQPAAGALVPAHAKNIQVETRGRIRAHMKLNLFSGSDARPRAIAFNPRAAILRFRVNGGFCQQPIASARTGILATD